jgi:hypothetical protein
MQKARFSLLEGQLLSLCSSFLSFDLFSMLVPSPWICCYFPEMHASIVHQWAQVNNVLMGSCERLDNFMEIRAHAAQNSKKDGQKASSSPKISIVCCEFGTHWVALLCLVLVQQ